MAHFYLNERLGAAEVGDIVELAGAEARHAFTVSRVRAGETIAIGNGAGLVLGGIVRQADAAALRVEVSSAMTVPAAGPALWLAQALAKGDRDELAVQAATELGVDGVIPWAAARSISRWVGPKVAKGRERWTAIVREATKQSMRPWLPEVGDLVATKELAALAATTQMFVLEPGADLAFSSVVLGAKDVIVVVGPEGGIAADELELLRRSGACLVRLGDTVLRTSTAGPAALAVLNAKLGRW